MLGVGGNNMIGPGPSNPQTTFVTVVFEGDELMLRLQARSLARYARNLPGARIMVIENFGSPRSSGWREALRTLYGDLAPHVRVIAASELVSNAKYDGWWKQQLLKLVIARHVETDTYLVLDGKTLLVRDLSPPDLYAADGKPKMAISGYEGHPLQWFFDKAIAYFSLEREKWVSRFVETAPPFMIDTVICRELMAHVEAREGKPFENAFIATGITEFFLYGAYIATTRGSLEAVYDIADLACETIWPHEASREKTREKLATLETKDSAFFAVHRRALGNMTPEIIGIVSDFLHERGLDAAGGYAFTALTQTSRRGRREQKMMDLKNRIAWRLKKIRQMFGLGG